MPTRKIRDLAPGAPARAPVPAPRGPAVRRRRLEAGVSAPAVRMTDRAIFTIHPCRCATCAWRRAMEPDPYDRED